MRLTHEQRAAVEAAGNVLVMAGAGTGKTHTLVGRCLRFVLGTEPRVPLDRLLLVTFTEAAATEMRLRLREELEQAAAARPGDSWVDQQLALLEAARISTLHSFCFQLVRDHFHELGLDPQVSVLTEPEARLLERETLDALLERHYAADTPASRAVQQLVVDYGRGGDTLIRDLVLRLHHYAQTQRNPAAWFERELAATRAARPVHWKTWLRDGFEKWRRLWIARLQAEPAANDNAHLCAAALDRASKATPENMARALAEVVERGAPPHWRYGTKAKYRDPIAELFEDAAFLLALVQSSPGVTPVQDDSTPPLFPWTNEMPVRTPQRPTGQEKTNPLAEDWQWVRGPMTALLQLAREFSQALAAAKRAQGTVDFHDLEQFALELLWGRNREQLSPVAQQWREQLDLVFVDEYQDINEAQDAILLALTRDGEAANRFLVGDVKQSIYRFRLADPRIFQRYAAAWQDGSSGGQVRPLSGNWRSAEALLNFVNALFGAVMREEVGGVEYRDAARLKFGDSAERAALRVRADDPPRVELHLRVTGLESAEAGEAPAADERGEWSDAEQEAWLVASRLHRLEEERFQVWDKARGEFRPVGFADMAVLLRAPRNKAEVYAKVFAQAGVPLVVARSGFFEAQEIRDLLALLEVLDNPLQDLPLLAVLRSPLVGLTLDELALVRLARRDGVFWTALRHFHREPGLAKAGTTGPTGLAADRSPAGQSSSFAGETPAARSFEASIASAHTKVARFLGQFGRWRDLARRRSLSECLETVLDETSYETWLAAEPRGTQRQGNVQRLLGLTRQFDQFQRQGLFRFLRFVEAQREAELDLEPAALPTENAVQLRSIHQSKGLEFPVVVVADLGRRFNFEDLKGQVILDEEYGVCPQVKPPHTAQRYPSLPYWLARRRQRQESLGEEIRLLYVACTRARDQLILVGTASRKAVEAWPGEAVARLEPHRILAANSCLAWLGRWLPAVTNHSDWTQSGQSPLLAWTVYAGDTSRPTPPAQAQPVGDSSAALSPVPGEALRSLRQRLAWQYPFTTATTEKAKVSVTELRRRAAEDVDDEAMPVIQFRVSGSEFRVGGGRQGRMSAAEVGTAHHRFLQGLDLTLTGSVEALRAEAARLCQAGVLAAEETEALDLKSLAAFWTSELGRRICDQAAWVRRELPFTTRLAPAELEAAGLPVNRGLVEDDFLVVQGVIDLAVFAPHTLWLLDFKTDEVKERELAGKVSAYGPQLKLYALALERIYGRPVSERWLHFLKLGRTLAV